MSIHALVEDGTSDFAPRGFPAGERSRGLLALILS